jgi:hypothetical protein
LQRAADVAGGGVGSTQGTGTVFIADGTYTSGASVTYYKLITFQGNCANPERIVVSTPKATAFNAQDFAIVTVKCLTIDGPGGVALEGRQYAIIDYQQLRFGTMSVHVSAKEMSKANCGDSVSIIGSASYHLVAHGLSTIEAGCVTTIRPGVAFSAFAVAVARSLIQAGSAKFNGSSRGAQYINDSSLIIGGKNFPGTSGGNICRNQCLIESSNWPPNLHGRIACAKAKG